MDAWTMTVDNSINAIILLRVALRVAALEQPGQEMTFVRGVNLKFMPARKDRLVVSPFNEPARIEAVEWSIFPRHHLMPFVKASVSTLKLGKSEMESLLEDGWEEGDKFKGDLKCSGK